MDWFYNFPDMSRSDLRDYKKSVDFAFTDFSRTYGEAIESFFEPLLMFLVWFEKFFINTPWPLIVLGIIFLAWVGSRSLIVVFGTFIREVALNYFVVRRTHEYGALDTSLIENTENCDVFCLINNDDIRVDVDRVPTSGDDAVLEATHFTWFWNNNSLVSRLKLAFPDLPAANTEILLIPVPSYVGSYKSGKPKA